MRRAVGHPQQGLVMQAISAVDIAWWDLKARLLEISLLRMFGCCRDNIPVYGSGGFDDAHRPAIRRAGRLVAVGGRNQHEDEDWQSWGSRIDRDLARVRRLRELAGNHVEAMVDANGAYTVGQARRVGARLDELGVTWFEEPVFSDDRAGLGVVRDAVRCDVAAGEYAADLDASRPWHRSSTASSSTPPAAAATRMAAGRRARSGPQPAGVPHRAPALHAPVAAAVPNLRHVEWFADHARLEPELVDGTPAVHDGALHPDPAPPGHGMTLRREIETRRTG